MQAGALGGMFHSAASSAAGSPSSGAAGAALSGGAGGGAAWGSSGGGGGGSGSSMAAAAGPTVPPRVSRRRLLSRERPPRARPGRALARAAPPSQRPAAAVTDRDELGAAAPPALPLLTAAPCPAMLSRLVLRAGEPGQCRRSGGAGGGRGVPAQLCPDALSALLSPQPPPPSGRCRRPSPWGEYRGAPRAPAGIWA